MGAKAWFAVYYNRHPKDIFRNVPELDREASASLAGKLLPGLTLKEKEDGCLGALNPGKREIFVGVYGDLKVVAHGDLSGDCPSRTGARWCDPELGENAYVHATHSVVDWCAFALWKKGDLVRALSVSADGGVHEDVGTRLPFEAPFWDGAHAIDDGDDEGEFRQLPFHPIELSDAALLEMLGFQFEGSPDDWACNPIHVPMMNFEISKRAWWKFW